MNTRLFGSALCAGILAVATMGACSNGNARTSDGEVTIQYPEFGSFDPHFSAAAQDIGHHNMVWRGLYRYDLESEVAPELADGLPAVSDDGLTYTVTLKDGLEWSDGEALTAEDFVLGMQRSCNPDVAGEYAQLLFNVAGCAEYYMATEASDEEKQTLLDGVGARAVDETTIEYTLAAPQATFLPTLTLWMTWPVPSHVVTEPDAEWPAPADLVFNGPFKVESYAPGDRMVFVRNEAYGGGDDAKLERVTFRYVEDIAQANNAFRNGELDVVVADTANLASLRGEFEDELVSDPLPSTRAVLVNMNNETLAKKDVRVALSRAIDREALVEAVLQGSGVPTTSWVPASVLGEETDFSDEVGFNADEAKAALERAGYPGGDGFPTLEYLIVDVPELRSTAEYLQAQWREILGIEVEIVALDGPTLGQRYGEGAFDMVPRGFAQDYSDPENWISVVVKDGPLNRQDCQDPDINSTFDEAITNTDNEERIEQYRTINEILSTELCGMIVLNHGEMHTLVDDSLSGPAENASPQDLVLAGDRAIEEWETDN